MAQNRIFFAVYRADLAECGTNTFTPIHGLQSASLNTRFSLDPINEIGQLELYENSENIPEVEATLEKVLDGYPLIYHLATKRATSPTLSGRSAARATLHMAFYTDTQDSASGTPLDQVVCSGMYVSALNYNFQVQGPFTESVTLVGNNKIWSESPSVTAFNNNDTPLALASGLGGVNKRQHLIMGEHSGINLSRFPTDIPGISASGYNPWNTVEQKFAVHMQSVRVSTNLGREQLFELGRRGPYFRFVNFPVPVRTDIEVLSTQGDAVTCLEDSEANLSSQTIFLAAREGTKLTLGPSNKLVSVTTGGANAGQGGGNLSSTYSYENQSKLDVQHPQDPAGL